MRVVSVSRGSAIGVARHPSSTGEDAGHRAEETRLHQAPARQQRRGSPHTHQASVSFAYPATTRTALVGACTSCALRLDTYRSARAARSTRCKGKSCGVAARLAAVAAVLGRVLRVSGVVQVAQVVLRELCNFVRRRCTATLWLRSRAHNRAGSRSVKFSAKIVCDRLGCPLTCANALTARQLQ